MNERILQDLYGLKYDPFQSYLPEEGIWEPPEVSAFLLRMGMLVKIGGFALMTGEPGTGKSKALQLLASRLMGIQGVVVGVMERPQSTLMDFYREMGRIFDVNLAPANRYGGFQALRLRWKSHFQGSFLRPVLLVDEAQECPSLSLNELRLLASDQFDSYSLLTVVLCGDQRLQQRLATPELLPLSSRIRARLSLPRRDPAVLRLFLTHSLERAGASQLMNDALVHALCHHADGNLRQLQHMASQILWAGAERKLSQLDEQLFLDLFAVPAPVERTHSRRRP